MTSTLGPQACTKAGWFWFCDEHDTHGNADSVEEAGFIADAHSEFQLTFGDHQESRESCVTVLLPVETAPT